MNMREALQQCTTELEFYAGAVCVEQFRAALANAPGLVSVKVECEPDPDPDLDWLGQYSNEPGPADRTVDREERGDCGSSRKYRYFIAAMSGAQTGNPDSVEQDYQRMEAYNRGEWGMIGIRAVAEVHTPATLPGCYSSTQYIRTPGLWGIESNSDDDFVAAVKQEQLHELHELLGQFGVDLSNWDALTAKIGEAR